MNVLHPALSRSCAALIAALACQTAHADLVGETLAFERLAPDIFTRFGPALTKPTVTVTAGDSDNTSWNAVGFTFLTVMPEASAITFSFVANDQVYGGGLAFNGDKVSGFSTPITAVSLSSDSTTLAPTLTWTTDSVYLNLAGGSCTAACGTVVLEFAAALSS